MFAQGDPSSRASVASHANSTLSQTPSTRYLIPPTSMSNPASSSQLSLPPTNNSQSNLSLTINYLPSKFSNTLISPTSGGFRRRKDKDGLNFPKMGGGVDAFRSGANRIPGAADEDDDSPFSNGKRKKKLRWNRFKWILFCLNTLLTIYSITSLIFCLLTFFNVWTHADVVRVGNQPELITSTIAAVTGILTSLIGWAGILLNNRAFLAVYSFMTWITFAFLVVPGYITYRRRTFNLEGKINAQWSRDLGASGRLRIQNQLGCCGYFSPFIEATISATCYARAVIPGCKGPYIRFQRLVLGRWFKVAFTIAPIHMCVMVAALLCSNHVTYRFGKGMMPKAYRLNMGDMAVIMDGYANKLAEVYGPEVAGEVLKNSKSRVDLGMTPMGYAGTPSSQTGGNSGHVKYDSLGS